MAGEVLATSVSYGDSDGAGSSGQVVAPDGVAVTVTAAVARA